MPCSPLAYLADIVDCCDAIAVTLEGIDMAAYQSTRTVRPFGGGARIHSHR